MSEKNQPRAMMLGAGAVLCWSTVATAFKIALSYMSPAQLLLWASTVSLLFLLGATLYNRQGSQLLKTFRSQPVLFCALGAINPCIYYLVLFQAYDLLPAQQAQTLNYTWALMLAVLAVPFLKQKLTRRDMSAMVLGYLGAIVIATRGDLLDMQFDSLTGVALAIGSTVLWASYWILNTKVDAPPAVALTLCFMVGTPLVWIYTLANGESPLVPLQGWLAGVYVGLFEMGITFMLWLAALRRATHVSRVGNLIFLSPFLSLIFIRYFLNEPLVPATFIGLTIISIAVIWQQRGKTSAD